MKKISGASATFQTQAVARHQVAAGQGLRHVHILLVRAQLELRDPYLERERAREFILERNPLGRIGDPIEVVG